MGIYGIAIFYGLGVLKMIENPQVGRLSNLEGYVAFSYYLGVYAFVSHNPWMLFNFCFFAWQFRYLEEELKYLGFLGIIGLFTGILWVTGFLKV